MRPDLVPGQGPKSKMREMGLQGSVRGRTWVTTGRWPVCAMIARSDLPAFAAAVARPALRL